MPGPTWAANCSSVLCRTQKKLWEYVTLKYRQIVLPPPSQLNPLISLNKGQKERNKPTRSLHAHTLRGVQSQGMPLLPGNAGASRALPAGQGCACHRSHPAPHTRALLTYSSVQTLKPKSFSISVHHFYIKVITNSAFVSNMYHILVLTLRHPGCMISLQMEHSISMRLNLLSSSSTVSSFPASPHTRHTAVWGSTGCLWIRKNWSRHGRHGNTRAQCAFTVSSFQRGDK